MRINHNIPALNTYNKMQINQNHIQKTTQKISSGLRINQAADDAAGLGISEGMRAQIRGLEQAERNIQDGISLIQTAENGLAEIENPLVQRMRELAVQASNDSLTPKDKQAIQDETNQIKQNINDIANHTTFNGIHLLNGTNPFSSRSSTQQSSNGGTVLSASPVASNGQFTFATQDGYSTTVLDNNQRLVYGSGGTSYPQVRIDGNNSVLYQHVQTPTQIIDGAHVTTYDVSGVTITQSVRIVGEMQDKYEIKYEVENNSAISKNIGVLYHIDTQLGPDDFAPFIVNGNVISNEKVYEGSELPNEFTVFNQQTGSGSNAEFQAQGIIKTTGEFNIIEEPDKFAIGLYSDVRDWDFTPSGSVGDSGYSLWWNERVVESGESFVVNTYYGQSVPETIEAPSNSLEEGPYDIFLQVGTNSGNSFKVRLSDVRTSKLGLNDVQVDPFSSAQEAIRKIDQALEVLSSERVKFGSYQNALEHINANVSNYKSNLTASESQIRDADIPKELTKLANKKILLESSNATLAQANQLNQKILEFLN